MAEPNIQPGTIGAGAYMVEGSERAAFDLAPVVTSGGVTFTVRLPATGTQVTLLRGGASRDLLPGPVSDATTFINRQVDAEAAVVGVGQQELTCTLSATAMAGPDQWTVRVTGLGGR